MSLLFVLHLTLVFWSTLAYLLYVYEVQLILEYYSQMWNGTSAASSSALDRVHRKAIWLMEVSPLASVLWSLDGYQAVALLPIFSWHCSVSSNLASAAPRSTKVFSHQVHKQLITLIKVLFQDAVLLSFKLYSHPLFKAVEQFLTFRFLIFWNPRWKQSLNTVC